MCYKETSQIKYHCGSNFTQNAYSGTFSNKVLIAYWLKTQMYCQRYRNFRQRLSIHHRKTCTYKTILSADTVFFISHPQYSSSWFNIEKLHMKVDIDMLGLHLLLLSLPLFLQTRCHLATN